MESRMGRRRGVVAVKRWPLAGLFAVILSAGSCGLLRVDVVGNSMSPTLKDGESAIATRRFDRLNRGDVVGFKYPRDESKSFVLRIVALPGDTKEGKILINGNRLKSGTCSRPIILQIVGARELFPTASIS